MIRSPVSVTGFFSCGAVCSAVGGAVGGSLCARALGRSHASAIERADGTDCSPSSADFTGVNNELISRSDCEAMRNLLKLQTNAPRALCMRDAKRTSAREGEEGGKSPPPVGHPMFDAHLGRESRRCMGAGPVLGSPRDPSALSHWGTGCTVHSVRTVAAGQFTDVDRVKSRSNSSVFSRTREAVELPRVLGKPGISSSLGLRRATDE